MLIVTAVNITRDKKDNQVLARRDGTADYDVRVAVNAAPPIWAGIVKGHIRKEGASALLRRIADRMELYCEGCGKCLDCIREERRIHGG